MSTQSMYFRPRNRTYTGPHNPQAYEAAKRRNMAQNHATKMALETPAKKAEWLAADPTRNDVIAFLEVRYTTSTFYASLVEAWHKWGSLTANQEAAVRRNMSPTAAEDRRAQMATVASTEGLSAITSLIQTGSRNLKRPAIVFALPEGPTVRISQAGPQSNAPGALNVKTPDGVYVGRIHLDGKWAPAREFRGDTAIQSTLAAFAAAPAQMAAAYGHRTGHCCFCSKALTDPRSVAAGYGETCAGHYNLPWGA